MNRGLGPGRLGVNCALAAAAVLLLSIPCRGAVGTTYTFKDLYSLGLPPGYGTVALDLATQPVAVGGIVFGRGNGPATGGYDHAMLWNGSSTPIDMNPPGYLFSKAYGVKGGQEVGIGSPTQFNVDALLWSGTNPAAIDLHSDPEVQISEVYFTSGAQQVGYAGGFQARLWNGSNAAISLHPDGFNNSRAFGTDGQDQVGYGDGPVTGTHAHALLWHGTNAYTDLNPAGFSDSYANRTNGGYQVGYGYTTVGNEAHALLWHSTNAAIDLNPPGFTTSGAIDVGGGQQVGFGNKDDNVVRALVWNGSNAATDLSALLPADFTASYAYTLDAAGNIWGLGYDTSNNWHAVEWAATVPEPSTSAILLIALGMGRCRRRSSLHR